MLPTPDALRDDVVALVLDYLDDRVVWKLSVAPTAAPGILSALSHLKEVEAYLDAAGGLIWLATTSCVHQKNHILCP